MNLEVKKSDRPRQKDAKVSLKQIAEFLSLEEHQRIAQNKIKYVSAAKIELVYYWVWKYETEDPYQMYALVFRQREKMYSQPHYTIASCSDKDSSSFDEMLVNFHIRNEIKSL